MESALTWRGAGVRARLNAPAFRDASRPLCRAHLLGLALFAACLFTGSSAHAYRTQNDEIGKPGGQPIRWTTTPVILDTSARMGSEHVSLLEQAAAEWSSLSCADRLLSVSGTSAGAAVGDGRNTVHWVADWDSTGQPADAGAYTDVQMVGSGDSFRIVEADIYVNVSLVSDRGAAFTKAVLVHELGHVLGLAHPCEVTPVDGVPICSQAAQFSSVLMHPVYSSDRSKPASDDVAGVCWLYTADDACSGCTPARAEGESCSADSDCLAHLSCRSGACERGSAPHGRDCARHSDCQSGACVGYCVPPCDQTDQCEAGETCVHALTGGGGCVGLRRETGASCSSGSDCIGGRCLEADRESPICTVSCIESTDCSFDWSCEIATTNAGSARVCTPPERLRAGGGCTVSSPNAPSSRVAAAALLALAFGMIWNRRKKTAGGLE